MKIVELPKIGKVVKGKFPSAMRFASAFEESSIEFEGAKYIVGDEALRKTVFHISTVEDLVKFYPVLLMEVRRRLGEFSEAGISLPLKTFIIENYKLRQGKPSLITLVKENLKNYGFNVDIIPQGLSATQYLIAKGEIEPKVTLVIDGGFNTVNLAIVDVSSGKPLFTETLSDEAGIRTLIEEFFKPLLELEYSGEVKSDPVILKEIFLRGKDESGLTTKNLEPLKEKAVKDFIAYLAQKVSQKLKRVDFGYAQVVFVGGVNYYVSKYEEEIKQIWGKEGEGREVIIPETETGNAEFMNMLGMFYLKPELEVAVDAGFGDVKFGKKLSPEEAKQQAGKSCLDYT